ncbi:tetratricopeptide repeat protein [Arenimonas sp.]|uniref:tetratricopeptide repeat protein n=1 Tax=Arenimonas sp. TaxID=1872635 RepID=UPI002E2ED55C|nr:tetratricopeptide repeat protein [Arenimonas sp.]HEX4853132.1 tetratricopeptide repeat protein [Arenimonas sp.]
MNHAGRLAGAAGLLLAIGWAYAAALAAPFHFDDFHVIVDNPRVHGLAAWWDSMPGIRPLLKLSYALDWMRSPGAAGFHATNLWLHGLNALLVWAVARQWLARLAPAVAPPGAAAWGVALLFALHPAATEAVTYVSGRSQSLMAMFYLAALWAHAHALERGSGGAWRALSPLLFAAALAVRETAVTLPFALALLAWYGGESLRDALRGLAGHGAVLALAVALAIAWPGYGDFFGTSLQARGLAEQLAGQSVAWTHLFGHSLFGLQTNLDPDLRVPAAVMPHAVGFVLAGVAAMAVGVFARRRWPWLGFAIAWTLLQLAPTQSLLPRLDLANDRHLYLVLPGVAFAGVVALARLAPYRLAAAAVCLLALVLAMATRERNEVYRSELALWSATAAASPGKARAWSNLGWARQQAGDPGGARRAYACALALDPGHRQAAINLSLLPPGPSEIPPECGLAGRVASPSPL